ncbi:MAG: GNAT family N-acetyltransferase [Defluviitaleaceae bacterium]|nr:GNAT family N-acetyltransferase [Defluviitaleaceae bacterium]
MINLQPITSKNDDEICGLKADGSLVRHNEGSLADAYVYWAEHGSAPIVYGIYNDETPVGLVMVAYFEDDDYDDTGVPYYFLWRLMIDESHQNKGYGREAMKLIMEEVKTFPKGEANAFYTSTAGEAALKLYESCGFERTGQINGREVVLRLTL